MTFHPTPLPAMSPLTQIVIYLATYRVIYSGRNVYPDENQTHIRNTPHQIRERKEIDFERGCLPKEQPNHGEKENDDFH